MKAIDSSQNNLNTHDKSNNEIINSDELNDGTLVPIEERIEKMIYPYKKKFIEIYRKNKLIK